MAITVGEADGLLVPGDLDRLARELLVQEAILGQAWKADGVVHTTTRGEVLADDPDDPDGSRGSCLLTASARSDSFAATDQIPIARLTKAGHGRST